MRCLLILFLCSFVYSATFNVIQRGATTIASDATTDTVDLASKIVDSMSVLIFTHRVSGTNPSDFTCSGNIISDSTLEFQRNTSNSITINIDWTVLEFSEGVVVQRGTGLFTSGDSVTDITISEVNVDKTWPICYANNSGSVFNRDDAVVFDITDSVTLTGRLIGGVTTSEDLVLNWQVIQYDSCTIQVLDGTFNNSTTLDIVITEVDVNKTLVFGSTGGDLASHSRIPTFFLQDSVTFRSQKGVTNVDMTVKGYIVSFTDSVLVSDGAKAITNGNATGTESFSFTSIDSTALIPGQYQFYNPINTDATADPDDVAITASFDGNDDMLFTRAESVGDITVRWQTIEFFSVADVSATSGIPSLGAKKSKYKRKNYFTFGSQSENKKLNLR